MLDMTKSNVSDIHIYKNYIECIAKYLKYTKQYNPYHMYTVQCTVYSQYYINMGNMYTEYKYPVVPKIRFENNTLLFVPRVRK